MRLGCAFSDNSGPLPKKLCGRLVRYATILGAATFFVIAVGTIAALLYIGGNSKEATRQFEQGGSVPVLPFLALTVLLWFTFIVGARSHIRNKSPKPEAQASESIPILEHLAITVGAPMFAHGAFSLVIPALCTFFFGTNVSLRAQVTETGIEWAGCNFAVLAEAPSKKEFKLCVGLKLLMQLVPGDTIDINARLWHGYTLQGDVTKAAPNPWPKEQPVEIRERILRSHLAKMAPKT